MKIHLKKIILWSEYFPDEKRELTFHEGKVNVITGNSQTGKSAIIPIIDYCLCSSQCKIPLGKIRESCSWFGILMKTGPGDLFIARRSPLLGKPSADVFLTFGHDIKIPPAIEEGNISLSDAKKKLNTIFEFPFTLQENIEDGSPAPRPSFRDVISLCFQPQSIIANPDVFFYKCNEAVYAKRLQLIFPFLLNAITPEWFAQKEELRQLSSELRELDRNWQANLRLKKNAAANAKAKLLKSKSLGIYKSNIIEDMSIEHYINEIISITDSYGTVHEPSFDDEQAQTIIKSIVDREKNLSLKYATLKQRLKFIIEVGTLYSSNMNSLKRRREHLNLASDILSYYDQETVCPFCRTASPNFIEKITPLIDAVSEFEEERKKWGTTYNTALDIERLDIRNKMREIENELTLVEQERTAFIKETEERERIQSWAKEVDSLIGELKEFLSTIKILLPTDNEDKINALKVKINSLIRTTAPEKTKELLENAIRIISETSFTYCKMLDIEWGQNKAKLDVQNLTVRIERQAGDAFLWEIGSASNWLAYHLGFMLGIHEFAAKYSKFIPSILVFDQPTQAYFPSLVKMNEDESYWDNSKTDDTRRSNNIFKLLDNFVEKNDEKIQIILFEHAPVDMFSLYKNTYIIEEWREHKLIPKHWYEERHAKDAITPD